MTTASPTRTRTLPTTLVATPITTAPISTADLATSIRADVHGDVLTADDTSYPAAVFGVDPAGRQPEIVVIAADAHDVAATIGPAHRAGRRVVLQTAGRLSGSGGLAGSPIVLIVTRLLARVRIDPSRRTAEVGIGATWRQVQDAAAPFGLAAVRGPVAGGSGAEPAAVGFGFAAEHVTALDVVTPRGAQIRVERDRDPAGFAGYRRRRGEFGLVTALTISLVPADRVQQGDVWFSVDDPDRVRDGWHRLASSLPPGASSSMTRRALPAAPDIPVELRGRRVVQVRFSHLGDPAGGSRLRDRLHRIAPPLWRGHSMIDPGAPGEGQ